MSKAEHASLDNILNIIKNTELAVVCVSSKPCFFYSIGAAAQGLPDIFISGNLPSEKGITIVNDIFSKIKKDGYVTGVMKGIFTIDCYLLPCFKDMRTLKSEFTVQAESTYNYVTSDLELTSVKRNILPSSGTPEFVQFVYPDENGKFPWDDTYQEDRFPQRIFCESPKSIN